MREAGQDFDTISAQFEHSTPREAARSRPTRIKLEAARALDGFVRRAGIVATSSTVTPS
jgi:hypothetical protein